MNLLLIFPVFIIAFAIILYYECKIRNLSKNNVHFYVARDRSNNTLYIYLGTPRRDISYFYPSANGSMIAIQDNFSNFGLDEKDFDNLKFEDEPVEVFLDLED